MPELPDLEALRDYLNPRIVGQRIERAQVVHPIPIRHPPVADFVDAIQGNRFSEVGRRGKFLLLGLESGHTLAINFMLAGRLQYCLPKERRRAKTVFILGLENGLELRYFDPKVMGKVYLVDDLGLIPRFDEMGPEALDPELTLEVFQKRLRRHPGQIKGILVNDTFVAGIGNAYADEILWAARIHPYRTRPRIRPEETAALYEAMRSVLSSATETVKQRLGDRPSTGSGHRIEDEIRDFLQVHGKGGQPCPRCGSPIAQITAGNRLTNFCWHCQA